MPECGVLKAKVDKAAEHLRSCRLCPHLCGVDRATSSGYCEAPDRAVVSSVMPHFGEESVLVGRRGSGTIFFGHCNLRCVFCQNCELSFYGEGEEVSDEELAASMLLLQNRYGCHNVNLVTPTHFVPNILHAYHVGRRNGLDIPLVYNCGGYECVETLKLLEGVVGIYMPDFKYLDPDAAEKYSGATITEKPANTQWGSGCGWLDWYVSCEFCILRNVIYVKAKITNARGSLKQNYNVDLIY